MLKRLKDYLTGLTLSRRPCGWPGPQQLCFRGQNCQITASLNWVVLRHDDGRKLTIDRRDFPAARRHCSAAMSNTGYTALLRGRRGPVTFTRHWDDTTIGDCLLTTSQLFELREWLDHAGQRSFVPFTGSPHFGQPCLVIEGGRPVQFGCRFIYTSKQMLDLTPEDIPRLIAQLNAALARDESEEDYRGTTVAFRIFLDSVVFSIGGSEEGRNNHVLCDTDLVRLVATLEHFARK